MKKLFFIGCFGLAFHISQAQHFYFIEENNGAGWLIKQKLRSANQYVIDSPLGSDYILKTAVLKASDEKFSLKISLIDTLSQRTILEAEEKYFLGRFRSNDQLVIPLAMQCILEKNLQQIIMAADGNHARRIDSELKAGKDKI